MQRLGGGRRHSGEQRRHSLNWQEWLLVGAGEAQGCRLVVRGVGAPDGGGRKRSWPIRPCCGHEEADFETEQGWGRFAP